MNDQFLHHILKSLTLNVYVTPFVMHNAYALYNAYALFNAYALHNAYAL